MNYKVDFHLKDNAEIYVSLTNMGNGNVVFYEKVTEQVVPVVKEYLERIKV